MNKIKEFNEISGVVVAEVQILFPLLGQTLFLPELPSRASKIIFYLAL
jgi:hypothetical protein